MICNGAMREASNDNNSGGSFITTFASYTFSTNLRTNQFAFADTFSSIINGGDTYTFTAGSATSGLRFFAETYGLINTFGVGSTAFPGPTNGTITTGGQLL